MTNLEQTDATEDQPETQAEYWAGFNEFCLENNRIVFSPPGRAMALDLWLNQHRGESRATVPGPDPKYTVILKKTKADPHRFTVKYQADDDRGQLGTFENIDIALEQAHAFLVREGGGNMVVHWILPL